MLTNRTPSPTTPFSHAPEPDRPRPDSDPSVEKIEAVCSKHSIPCGKPDSLERFVRALRDDKHFAMDFWSLVAHLIDFWALVASLTDQDRSADPDRLLAAIVQAVTGCSLDDVKASGPTQQILVQEISRLLAGEDVQTPLPPRPVQSARPSDGSGPNSRADVAPRRGAIILPPPAPSSDTSDQPRLVPRSETPFAAAMDRNLREQEPDPNPRESEPEPQIAIPFASYAEENADGPSVRRKLTAGVLLTLAAALGVLLYRSNWSRLSTSIHAQYAAATARRNQTTAPSAASINGDQRNFTANSSAGPTDPQPASGTASANPSQPAPGNPNPSGPVAPHNTPSIASSGKSLASYTASLRPHAEAWVVVPEEAQMAIPESQMKQNLVSSRVPLFPAGAHGPVVVQAIVTELGKVEPIRVVSGDPSLARAAMAAVATWHYRPYLQNGEPVSVSTTISVDSDGNN